MSSFSGSVTLKYVIGLMTSIILLGLALFYGFVNYEWICEFHASAKMSTTQYDVHHGLILLVAITCFLGSVIMSRMKNLDEWTWASFSSIFVGTGKK